MTKANALLFGLALGIANCRTQGTNKTVEKQSTAPVAIDIKPGQAIGEISLGANADQLPKRAVVSGDVGELEGIHFLLRDGKVDDVWIEDLRTFSLPVRFEGRTVPRDASLADLKALFGACQPVAVKGGAFFNCSKGITIGCDFEELGQFVQLRLKPR